MTDVFDDKALLQQVLTATTDAIMVIDRSWTTVYMNEPALEITKPLGFSPLGKEFWSCFPEAAYPDSPYVETYHRAMDEGTAGEIEAYYPPPLDFWFHVQVRPTAIGIILFTRNITLQKRMTASLISNERLVALGRLSAVIAHEINNPLQTAQNLLFLAEGAADLNEAAAFLKMAKAELDRISAITRQTLRVNKASLKPNSVTAADMLKGLLLIFEGKTKRNGVKLDLDLSNSIDFNCFEGEIRQVLNNLVGNAIDAMPSGGRLVVRVRRVTLWRSGKAGVQITIADSGCGMSPKTRANLFHPFFTTKGMDGTGLGLWISKEFVEKSGGRLLLRTSQQPPYCGTTFLLLLPLESETILC